MKTFSLSAEKAHAQRQWLLVDAEGQTLGRLATRIATLLRGKHKPTYTPHVDNGDYVVVINCGKVQITGDKLNAKEYHRHSGYPGGLTSVALREQLERFPDRVLRDAVKGMLPKTRQGRAQLSKLKVYAEGVHPHQAQNPRQVKL